MVMLSRPGTSRVADEARQRLLQITELDDCIHRRSRLGRQAYGLGTPHAGFGPLAPGAPGLTLCRWFLGRSN